MKSILKTTEHTMWKKEYPLEVSTIGLSQIQYPIVRPHGIPIYQVFYCTAGVGELSVEDHTYRIETGNGFLLSAGIV